MRLPPRGHRLGSLGWSLAPNARREASGWVVGLFERMTACAFEVRCHPARGICPLCTRDALPRTGKTSLLRGQRLGRSGDGWPRTPTRSPTRWERVSAWGVRLPRLARRLARTRNAPAHLPGLSAPRRQRATEEPDPLLRQRDGFRMRQRNRLRKSQLGRGGSVSCLRRHAPQRRCADAIGSSAEARPPLGFRREMDGFTAIDRYAWPVVARCVLSEALAPRDDSGVLGGHP
jgi:hypothetical protein